MNPGGATVIGTTARIVLWGGPQCHLLVYIKAWNAHVAVREIRLLKFPRISELPMPKVL